jgi:hypothetical protein
MSASRVRRLRPESITGRSPVAATRRRSPGTLDLWIHRRGAIVELSLFGELDMATAPRLTQAMAWLRTSSGPATTIVIDTTGVDFLAAAGYHALQAALVGPNGLWDPHVALVLGPVITRFEAAISAQPWPARTSTAAGMTRTNGGENRRDL